MGEVSKLAGLDVLWVWEIGSGLAVAGPCVVCVGLLAVGLFGLCWACLAIGQMGQSVLGHGLKIRL